MLTTLTRLTTAGVAIAALTLGAPAAFADSPTSDCEWRIVSAGPPQSWPATFHVVVAGYAYHVGDVPTIRCYVMVDGVEAFTTSTLPGATADYGTITVDRTSDVFTCTEVTSSHGTHGSCADTDPPLGSEVVRTVAGLAESAVVDYVDPVACQVLAASAGTYGDVFINSQGDVYVDGDPVWDCPPYDIWPPS